MERKELPYYSTWVILRDLPAGVTTDEQLSELLHKRGLPVPAEHVSFKRMDDRRGGAIVAVNSEVMRKIFQRVLANDDIAVITPRPKPLPPQRPKPLTPDFIRERK